MDKKMGPALVLALGKMKKDKPEEMESEEDSSYENTAQEILDAIKQGDAAALAESLKNFVSLCC